MRREASPTKALSILFAAVKKLILLPLSRFTSLINSNGSRNYVDERRKSATSALNVSVSRCGLEKPWETYLIVMRTGDKDCSAFTSSRNLPCPTTPDFPEENVDDPSPECRNEIVQNV